MFAPDVVPTLGLVPSPLRTIFTSHKLNEIQQFLFIPPRSTFSLSNQIIIHPSTIKVAVLQVRRLFYFVLFCCNVTVTPVYSYSAPYAVYFYASFSNLAFYFRKPNLNSARVYYSNLVFMSGETSYHFRLAYKYLTPLRPVI